MLSDIAIKYAAKAQLDMYTWLNGFATNHYTITSTPLALSILVTDVFIDTIKVPIASLENLTMGAINLSTAPFFKSSHLNDAYQNIKKAIGGLAVTPLVLLVSPLKLISQFCLVFPNMKEAKSCNKDAFEETQMNYIYTTTSNLDTAFESV